MIQLDEWIISVLEQIEVEHFPFSVMDNGKIQVAQSTKYETGCIVKTIESFKVNRNGTVDCKSVFYFFQEISQEGDVIDDLNVRSENILKKIIAFTKKLNSAPFLVNPNNDELELTAYEMITTAVETGLSFNVTFRLSYSQCGLI